MNFKLGEHYMDKGDDKGYTPRRANCPKCGGQIVRRTYKGEHYFEHCNRVFLDNRTGETNEKSSI